MLTQNQLQALVDGLNAQEQAHRSASGQLTLGGLIKLLEALHPQMPIVGLGELDSYRGYYCDLAFHPTPKTATVEHVLSQCRAAMGRVFEGYKGGDYVMGAPTPLWVSAYGEASGERLMGLEAIDEVLTPVTEPEE